MVALISRSSTSPGKKKGLIFFCFPILPPKYRGFCHANMRRPLDRPKDNSSSTLAWQVSAASSICDSICTEDLAEPNVASSALDACGAAAGGDPGGGWCDMAEGVANSDAAAMVAARAASDSRCASWRSGDGCVSILTGTRCPGAWCPKQVHP